MGGVGVCVWWRGERGECIAWLRLPRCTRNDGFLIGLSAALGAAVRVVEWNRFAMIFLSPSLQSQILDWLNGNW